MFDDCLKNRRMFIEEPHAFTYETVAETEPEAWVISNISVPDDGYYTIGTVNTSNPLEYEVTKIPTEVFNSELHYVGKLLKIERRIISGGN